MPESLPLFPLQAVLLPGASLPLHIFEPRYRQLTVDLVTGAVPGREFGVVAMRPANDHEVTDVSQLREIGCTAALRQAKRLPDGRYDIITTGGRRFRLLDLDAKSAPYLVGTVEWLPDSALPDSAPGSVAALADAARAAHRRYCEAAWQDDDWSEPDPDLDVCALAHVIAADCLLTLEDRQHLLEETRPVHRLRQVVRLLNRETGLLTRLRAVPAPPSEFTTPISLN
ncbi:MULTISPECIES: LON peptidase substrate-binding domain-containing protein [Actinokineospora]|uniref:Peptidase n=1 Tax=Actinokineospora fastidiosa TaxID=1816 RepID=A0A918GIE1_9PSEU|nr:MULTISPECIES: LON peptidase substrate-binding domain-containing protein [Actinokineospora]UVS80904.1 Lon protease 2 [Actinokineospora sp. UTMC 2448]GGS38084.1 peptidase [Actinokineospora fastidiosa]